MRMALAGTMSMVLLLLPAAAGAQESVVGAPRSVYASLGIGRFNSDGSQGNGPDIGGGSAYHF